MEAEYVALSTACKDFVPVIDLMKELSCAVGIPKQFVSNLHGKIFEDNVGTLTLHLTASISASTTTGLEPASPIQPMRSPSSKWTLIISW
jgi:hypothetical protein